MDYRLIYKIYIFCVSIILLGLVLRNNLNFIVVESETFLHLSSL